jgi:methionyl-tRNA formyltransferase
MSPERDPTARAVDGAAGEVRALRIVFYGSDRFAVPCFEAVIDAGHKVVALVTEPEREKGMGPDGVAGAWRLPILEPESLKSRDLEKTLRGFSPDVQLVAGYATALPRALLDVAPRGTVKLHPALLPRHRGAAPIEHAILAGDRETGVSAIRMEEQPDAGPILLSRATPIGELETGGELRLRLSTLMAELALETLAGLSAGSLQPKPQSGGQATDAPAISENDGLIDWNTPADVLARRVRAFNPWPSSTTTLAGQLLTIDRATHGGSATGAPGTVVETGWNGIAVVCGGNTVLRVTQLHLEGQRPQSPAGFVTRTRLAAGTLLG